MQEQINQLNSDLLQAKKQIDNLDHISIKETFDPTAYLVFRYQL